MADAGGATGMSKEDAIELVESLDNAEDAREILEEAGITVDDASVSLDAMKAALTAHYSGKQMDVTEAFQELDEDKSGYLDRGEVEKGLASLGLLLPSQDVDAVMLEMDPDGDGHVTLSEFTGWWVATMGTTKSVASEAVAEPAMEPVASESDAVAAAAAAAAPPAASAAGAATGDPADWEEHKTESGETYYFNKK
eukprot:SAG22_NODE_274_length_13178_cov_17.793715_1_plen_195_part_10